MESTAVQCSLQCTYMTHSPRCQRVIPPPRTHSLTHINCCSYAVICTIYVAVPVCKNYSIRNIVPDFYFEGFKETGFLFFPFKKKKKKSSIVVSMALNFLTQRVTPSPVPDSACALLNVSQTFTTISSRVSEEDSSGSLRPRFGPVSFSSSCQRQWRRAAPTAVGSTYELVLCSAAESKRLTFRVKSSLFNDGESLCAAMLPSSDPPSTARRTR